MRIPRYLLILIFFITVAHTHAQVVSAFSFNDINGSSITTETISGSVFQIKNHFNMPERIAGVEGNALRLDGYSTWALNNDYAVTGITDQMSVSCWYSTEAFNKEEGGLLSKLDAGSGFALMVNPYGRIALKFFADNTAYYLITDQSIEKYKWNHIAATIDLPGKKAKIYVNGQEWKAYDLAQHSSINMGNATFFIGRQNVEITNGGFLVTSLNGAIDEVKIYNTVITDTQIQSEYNLYSSLVPDLTINPDERYAGDFHRPKYHAMPNAVWTNEPYGLIFANGKYHLFFQKNPNSPNLYFMHWGHLSSPDLVNWTEEKIALAPSPGFDSFGVWSGTSTLDSNNSPVLVYTGVDGVKAGIGVAFPDDESLTTWSKYLHNPVIPSPPSNYQAMDFRDTFIWKANGYYYMIVGSGIQNSGGGILFQYKSSDLVNWTTLPPLYRNVYVSESGYFWEMPFFFPLNSDNEFILGVVPVPTQNKPAETLYWIGKWENEKFTPFFARPKKFELINGLMLSPAIQKDTAGRITYMGIIPEDRSAAAQIQAEWRHIYSIPRQLRLLKDSAVGHIPHPNLCRLRGSHTFTENRLIVPNTSDNLPEFLGTQSELSFKIKASEGTRFVVQVFKNQDAQEFTSLIFDLSTNKIAFDRGHSSLSPGTPTDYRSVDYVFDFNDTIKIDIFLDNSVIEVFIDDLAVYSMRVYPSRIESRKIDLFAVKGSLDLLRLDMWQLMDMNEVTGNEVCERTNLPDRFRVAAPIGLQEKKSMDQWIRIYPNPAGEHFTIENTGNYPYPVNLTISDIHGKEVYRGRLEGRRASSLVLDTSNWNNGQYLITLNSETICESGVIIIAK